MSDTPRTDAAMVDAKCPHCAGMGGFQVSEEEAQGCELCGTTGKVNVIPNGCGESLRTTERELAAARAELAGALKDRDEAREKARMNEPHLICMESGEVKVAIARKVMQNLVEMFAELNRGAQNYTESRFECAADGKAFVVTVQNAGAKSPHQLRADAEKELAEARECLRECIANFGELCAGGDKRWRKAAGVDTATPTNSGKS